MNPRNTGWAQIRQNAQAGWVGLQARERFLLKLTASAVGALLLWTLWLAPAWQLLSNAPAQQAKLDEQLQRMLALASQAQALQAQPPAQPEASKQALQAAVNRLGPVAQLSVAGDRATVVLKVAPSHLLAQLLTETRQNARVLPIAARLTVSAGTASAWDGSLVFALPQP